MKFFIRVHFLIFAYSFGKKFLRFYQAFVTVFNKKELWKFCFNTNWQSFRFRLNLILLIIQFLQPVFSLDKTTNDDLSPTYYQGRYLKLLKLFYESIFNFFQVFKENLGLIFLYLHRYQKRLSVVEILKQDIMQI